MSETSVTSEMSTTSAESALVTGQMYEEAVKQMIDMGFPREQVQRAMRASFNNPDRAVEYLFNVSSLNYLCLHFNYDFIFHCQKRKFVRPLSACF